MSELLVLVALSHVIIKGWYNNLVKWLIMVYYTLTTLRLLVGTLFMKIKMTKMPSSGGLT